jgi:hypothetical protein
MQRELGGDKSSVQFQVNEVLFIPAAYIPVVVIFVGTSLPLSAD